MPTDDEIRQRYADFLNKYGGNITDFCIRFCSNHSDAEDLMQEVFIALWKGLPQLRTDISHRLANRWLYKLMLSVYIKHVRRKPDISFMPVELLPETHTGAVDDTLVKLVDELTEYLSDEDRALVDDFRYGYKLSELAQRHNLSIGAVSTRLSRIKHKLKEIYYKYYGEQ